MGLIFHQLFQTQEQTPISSLGQKEWTLWGKSSPPPTHAYVPQAVSEDWLAAGHRCQTVTRPQRQTRTERTLPLHPSSLELMSPQASKHLGLTAQGSRWLPRGWGQGLFIIEEGPWDHTLGESGVGYILEKR